MEGALPVARALHFAATLILEGSLAFQLCVIRPVFGGASPVDASSRWLDRLAVVLAVLSGALWVGLLGADLDGTSISEALTDGADWLLLTGTTSGQVWILRGAGFLWLGIWLLVAQKRYREATASLRVTLIILLTGSLAWSGHGAMTATASGGLHTIADIIHLVVAGFWVGGLLPFAMTLHHLRGASVPGTARTITARFGRLALVSVGFILLTGIVNTWMILGGIAGLFDTVYGLLLIAKILLFASMLLFAATNRFVLTPKLSTPDATCSAVTRLQLYAACEFALSLLVIAIVGVLGIVEPR